MLLKTFKSKEELELELFEVFQTTIEKAIAQFGDARILLSGGSTPVRFYSLLSYAQLPWEKVKIGLVDERFVPLSDSFSNEALIRNELLKNSARNAELIGMVLDNENRELNLQLVNDIYALFKDRIDIVLLGMGEDGHTASLFPGDPASLHASQSNESSIFNTQAPEFPHDRITCGQKMLFKAEKKILLIKGVKKLKILKKSKLSQLPIAPFLECAEIGVYFND